MAIERSRTETIRDFTVHRHSRRQSRLCLGRAGERGGMRTFLSHGVAVRVVVASGNTDVGAGDRRRARFEFGDRMG